MSQKLNVLNYYLNQCNNDEWYQRYYKCGDDGDGSIFKCFSTNYRNLNSFNYYFNAFKDYIGLPRYLWDKKETTGQEVAKQYVVNLVQSFLYSSSRDATGELVYDLTSRGKDFDKMLKAGFFENEEKLLTFLFIVNSSFCFTPRYILKQSQLIWDKWLKSGLSINELKEKLIKFVKEQKNEKRVDGIFNYDIVWYLSFYSDENFLKLYQIAHKQEIKDLKEITIDEYKTKFKKNVLAWKYKSTNFQRPALFDTLVMLYISYSILEMTGTSIDFLSFYTKLVDDFNLLLPIDKNKVMNFIKSNDNVFGIIFANAVSEDDDFTERYVPVYRPRVSLDEEIPEEKIDTTSKEGVEKLEVVRQVLKKLAKEKSNYKCALESLNNCRYFTSKEEEKNFLEIHHFVPREFSCDFDDTIEFVENYVPLCPHCHRLLHKAVDRERQCLITYLYNQRISDLEQHHIDIDIETLYKYYRIDTI